MTEISVSEIMKLIEKADEAATPESLRAVSYTHLTLPTNREV